MVAIANSLEAQGVEDQRSCERSKRDGGTRNVEGDGTFATHTAERVELVPAQLRDVAGLSALTSRGFSWSDLTASADIQAFYFARMHGASMVPTGRRSGPGIDDLASDLDAHGVAGFDRLNPIPSNLDTLDGISDANSFIEDFNLWVDEEQICAGYDKDSPGARDQIGFDRTLRESLNQKSQHDDCRDAGREPDTAWTIETQITHAAIFSQQSGLEGSEK
jgi:hypothetical protein